MCRSLLALGLWLCLLSATHADDPATAAASSLEGAKLGKVPEAVYAQVPSLPAGKGVLVLEVTPGSAAAKAGLKQYDVLLSLDENALPADSELRGSITFTHSAKRAPVVLFRAGREMRLRIAPVQ